MTPVTVKTDKPEGFDEVGNPIFLAKFSRPKCVRCGCKINKGDRVERVRFNGSVWNVHYGCTQVEGQCEQHGSVQQGAESPVFDSEVVDKYIAGAVEKIKLEVGGELADKLSGTIDSTISSLAGAVAKVVTSKLEQSSLEMAAYVKQRIEEARLPRTIKIQPKGGEAVKLENEIYHPAFDKIVKLAARRQNIFLPGPAGCGKSHLAAQIARALGLPFGMISLAGGVTESKLVGRNVPNIHTGQDCYQITQFVKCFENGGVFLADECDAADPNVLLIINSALANGLLSVERNGGEVIQRHADFIFIAAANTFGRGADRQYVGRTELDGAFLDRFVIGQVPMDYDTALEEHVCPNKKLREKLWGYRAAIRKHRFERIMSTRTMISAYDMLTNGGFTMTDIDDAIFAGWPEDEAKKAKAGV